MATWSYRRRPLDPMGYAMSGQRQISNFQALSEPEGLRQPMGTTNLPGSADLAKSQNFQVHRPDTAQFGNIAGLSQVTGEPAHNLLRLMSKELADNGLDAADAAGRPGQVMIRRDGLETYIVTDLGRGIAGTPEDLAALFSIHRVMISGKFMRRPERGALGNGLRVIVGCVVASDGTIEIITRGKRVLLKPRRVGPTEIKSVSDASETPGTMLTVFIGPEMPGRPHTEDYDLALAREAIRLASHAATAAYARQPSPHWLDSDAFTELLLWMQPATATVRQIIGLFDGISGAKAGRIAAPFGKNRLARSLSDAEAASLLTAMQAGTRAIPHSALGVIGPEAYDPEIYDYARASGTFTNGAHAPQATIPYIVECWASARSRKDEAAEIDLIFGNRTVIPSDKITAERETYNDAKTLILSGCGLYDEEIKNFPLGDFTADLHIISPLIPLLSIGKRPDLGNFLPAIETALRRAVTKSRDKLPLDMPKLKAPPPLKPPREPKPEKSVKLALEIFEPQTQLGRILAIESALSGIPSSELMVLSKDSDPYGFDNAKGHLIGRWFADQIGDIAIVHLRGLFYRIVAAANAFRPDTGEKFTNTDANWRWFQQKASKAARWLGYVAFNRIRDQRSDPPELYGTDGKPILPTDDDGKRSLIVIQTADDDGSEPCAGIALLDRLLPRLSVPNLAPPRQPYQLAFIGEKSSLGEVLRPLAIVFQAELLLSSGDPSETHIAEIAARAADDGRPFRVFYFSDFDPGGFTMPIAVARKFQAHRDWRFPNLEMQVHRVALTLDQVIANDLPSTPLKATEARAARWLEKTGREQTEIDALAALRPDVLEQIARDAVAPFFDPTMIERFEAANVLPENADEWFDKLPTTVRAKAIITRLHGSLWRSIAAFNATVREQIDAVSEAVRDAEDAPELEPAEVEAEIEGKPPEPLFTTEDSHVDAVLKLRASKRNFSDTDDAGDD